MLIKAVNAQEMAMKQLAFAMLMVVLVGSASAAEKVKYQTMKVVPGDRTVIEAVNIMVVPENSDKGLIRYKVCEDCEYKGVEYDEETQFVDQHHTEISLKQLKALGGVSAVLRIEEGEEKLHTVRANRALSGGGS